MCEILLVVMVQKVIIVVKVVVLMKKVGLCPPRLTTTL